MTPKLLFGPCTVLDGYMYFFTFAGGILAKMDLATGAVELLETTFNHHLGKNNATGSVMTVDRNIYALMSYGKYLTEYCVDTKQVKEIEIGRYYRQGVNIEGWFEKDGKIYIYPIRQRKEIIYDRTSHMVSTRELGGKISDSPFRICRVNDCVYIFEESGDQVIRRNIDTGAEDVLTLNSRLEAVRHVVHKNDCFYILTAKREIYIWDHCSNDLKSLCRSETDDTAWRMAVLKDKIIIPPYHREELQVVDTASGAVSFLKEQPADFTYHPIFDWGRYTSGCEDQNNFYFSARTTNYVLVISKEDGKISWIRPLISSEEIMRHMFEKNCLTTYEAYFDLPSFIMAAESKKSWSETHNACVGNEIFKEIVNELRQ